MAVAKTNATDFLAESELTLSQLKVLFALGSSDGPMSVNELADRIHLSLAATGRIIDKLVGVTLVNRRVKRISLTDSGQEFIDSERAVMDDTITRFVSTLPADIGEQLRAALDRIVRADTDYFAACSHSPRTAAHPV